jgi:hypothetical protein
MSKFLSKKNGVSTETAEVAMKVRNAARFAIQKFGILKRLSSMRG